MTNRYVPEEREMEKGARFLETTFRYDFGLHSAEAVCLRLISISVRILQSQFFWKNLP